MAYVSHSSYRAYGHSTTRSRFDAALLARAAIVAMATATVIFALSGAGTNDGAAVAKPAFGKGDQLAASDVIAPWSSASYAVDHNAQTTTVEKGFVPNLSAESPYTSSTK